ncbi:MAG: methylated-DNA--[protein]-cysteine S-methyltransferase [Phycisphaerales bacterium]|nr:methylated-DNA--[protein]-cysteine S-methyltransferase [Phycisphaerales bacterium]
MDVARVSLDSPVGPLRIDATHDGVVACAFADDQIKAGGGGLALHHALRLRDELLAYFAGSLQHFTTPLAPEGTQFQRRVWDALREIPYAVLISYGQLAARVGCPDGARAVGLANAKNPIAIVIPCHRVIAADGTLHGYAGGLHRKARLLDHEQQHAIIAATLFAGR